MAKRSIEIIISAENRTGAALEAARADVARYADDVKRIQQNVRVGGEAFGGGLGRAEAGLASSSSRARNLEDENRLAAFERVRSDARSAAESEAYAIDARMGKEQYAAIRASVMGMEQFDSAAWRTREAMKGVAQETDQSVLGAIRFGKAMMIVHVATSLMRVATAALKGDWEAVGEAARRIPLIGEYGYAVDELRQALLGPTDVEKRAAKYKETMAGYDASRAGMQSVAAIMDKANFEASLAGLSEENRRLAVSANEREKLLAQIAAAPISPLVKAAAAKAVIAADAKKEEALTYQASMDAQFQKWKDEVAAEAKAAAEVAREKQVKADAAAEAQKKARAEREADNERYRRESFEGLQDEAMTAAEKAAEPRAASGIARRGGYSSVSAFDRGFLTRAPGSTFDESRAKHEENTAKATAATAKATEKTAKAVETLSLRQELLFRELLTALRPGKVINF